jgi:hypothetical protein
MEKVVSFDELSRHASSTRNPESDALRPEGAAGGRGFTTMEPVALLDPPLLSVTVRDAV